RVRGHPGLFVRTEREEEVRPQRVHEPRPPGEGHALRARDHDAPPALRRRHRGGAHPAGRSDLPEGRRPSPQGHRPGPDVPDPRAALQSLDRLAELDPAYPGLWVLKTKLHARLGEADRARQSRLRADQVELPETKGAVSTVPCPMCDAPVADDATACGNCGVKFAAVRNLEDELEDLGHAAIQDMVQEGLTEGRSPPVPEAAKPKPELAPPSKPSPK